MYFLLKMGIFQPAMLVYLRVPIVEINRWWNLATFQQEADESSIREVVTFFLVPSKLGGSANKHRLVE